MLRLLVVNTLSSSPVKKNKRPRLPATSVNNLPRSVAAVCVALGSRTVRSTRWSQILAENRDFCLPHLHSTPPVRGSPSEYCHNVWCWKTRMVLLPDGEKMSKIYLFIQACRPHRAATVLCYRFIEHILSESLSIVYYNHFHFWTIRKSKSWIWII